MALLSLYKENPTVKMITNLSAIVTAIAGFVIGVISFNGYYAHAADLETNIKTVRQEQQTMVQQMSKQRLEDRAKDIDNKLFELRLQPQSQQQQALIKYYQAQRDDITAKLSAKPDTPTP